MRAPDFNAWRQVPLSIDESYDYLRMGFFKTVFYYFFYTVAVTLLAVFNFVLFGTRLRGRRNLKGLRKKGLVVTCNHVHWLDCTVMAELLWPRRAYFITLQSNLELPFIRHLVRLLGGVPIPRNRRMLPRFRREVLRALEKGAAVPIYPEGELHPYAPGLYDFKPTAFALAYDADVPVLPMCVTYRKGRGLFRLKRRPCLTMHVLQPVFPDRTKGRREEVERMCEDVFTQMSEYTGNERKSPSPSD